MRGLETADAQAFYRTWYAPNNAVLVLAGDVTAEQRAPARREVLRPDPAARPCRRASPWPSRPRWRRRGSSMKSPRVAETRWSRAYLAPSY